MGGTFGRLAEAHQVRRALIWGSLLILGLVAGCQSIAQQPTATLPPQPLPTPLAAWTQAWLTSSPCRAPCWYGITPEETVTSDALTIVRSLPFVDQATIEPYGNSIGERGWTWQWTPPIKGKGQLMGYGEDLVYIDLEVMERIPVSAIIAQLGPPKLRTFANQIEGNQPVHYWLDLFWPEYGITSNGVSSFITPPSLQPDTLIENSIRLYSVKEVASRNGVSWPGYYSFDSYARLYRNLSSKGAP